tara:strand:- start:1493 stop:1840 length:348 start_codon:yes stop_codon:yes gene_type:complete
MKIAQGVPIVYAQQTQEIEFKAGEELRITENITPLMKAVVHNKLDIIELLLSNGANANLATNSGNTALHYASFMNHPDAIRILIKHGANVNALNTFDQTPLLVCTRKVLKCFVEN